MSERKLPRAFALPAIALAMALVPPAAHAQDWRTLSQSRQVAGERELRTDIEYAAGTLRISSAPEGTLYRVNLRYDADVLEPNVGYAGNRLRVGMDGASLKHRGDMKGGQLDVELGTGVPLDLNVQFGAAEADLQLGGLRIRKASISTGASTGSLTIAQPNAEVCRELKIEVGAARFEATQLGNLNAERIEVRGGVGEVVLDFGGDWRRDLTGTVTIGLGTLTLKLPTGLGVRIRKGGLLAPFDGQGLVKRGDLYFSEDWDTAQYKLSLDVDAALGSVRVVWVDSQEGR
ncbi:MAG: hypothetical protein WD054_01650 [Gemmatimonadota bacterium]